MVSYIHAAMVRTTVTCFLSQPDVRTVIDLETLFAKDLLSIEENWRFIHVRRVLECIFQSLKIWHTFSKNNFSCNHLGSFWLVVVSLRTASL